MTSTTSATSFDLVAAQPRDLPALIGIRGKVAVATALVFSATIALETAIVLLVQHDQLERMHTERVDVIARSLRGVLLATMVDRRREDLPGLLRAYGGHSDDSSAEIRNAAGVVIASSLPDRIGRIEPLDPKRRFEGPYLFDSELDGVRAITRVEPLFNRGACRDCHAANAEQLGHLVVTASRAAIDDRAAQLRNLMIGSSALTLLLLFGATWMTLSYLVVRPIQALAGTMRAARAGDLAARVREPAERDEIWWLGRTFNSMLEELAAARAKLEEWYKDRLTRADRFATVGQLASGLAHEIKNPLAGLSGALQIFAGDFADSPEKLDVVTEMQRQIDRLDQAMNDLLRFARPAKPEPSPTDLSEVLEHVVSLVKKQKSARNVRFHTELRAQQLVCVDPGQLEQVFLNLCLNALQAMPKGGTLTLRSADEGGQVVAEIADSGAGIPPEIRAKVFEPFFTTKTQGTGLGLSICDRIVSQHQGRIDFDCPPEGGTRFRVRLPRLAGEPSADDAVALTYPPRQGEQT